MKWIALFATVASLLVGAELENVVRPQWEVHLLQSSETHPGMGTLVQSNLYFTDWKGRKNCPARNLYRVALKEGRKEVLLKEVECISALYTDGVNLFVQIPSGQTHILQDDELREVPGVTQAILNIWNSRIAFHKLSRPGLSDKGKLTIRFVGQSYLFWQELSDGSVLADLYQIPSPHFVTDSGIVIKDPPALDQIKGGAVTQDKTSLTLLLHAETRNTLIRFPTRFHVRQPPEALGLGAASGQWEIQEKQAWHLGIGSFFSPTRESFIIYETSERAGAVQALSYFDSQAQKFFRVMLPEEKFLSGIQFTRGGMLVTRPADQKILWVGNQPQVFTLAEGVSPSDIRKNARVPATE